MATRVNVHFMVMAVVYMVTIIPTHPSDDYLDLVLQSQSTISLCYSFMLHFNGNYNWMQSPM